MTAATWWIGQKATYEKWDYVVYRVFDKAGRLIYIGSTRDIVSRFSQHERLSWWHGLIGDVTTVSYPNDEAALAAETVAIQEEQPAFNVRHTTSGPTLTVEDADFAWQWSQHPDHCLNSLRLVARVDEIRAAAVSQAA